MIVGCAGSGKSTLAQNLSKELGIDAMHLDSYFYVAGWKDAPKDQFQKAVEDFLKKDRWIIDGNYRRWTMNERVEKCDTIIHLDFSRWSCLYGVIRRRIQYHGKTRPDTAENCQEQIDLDFLKFVWNFNRDYNPEIKKLIADQKDKKIIVLSNRGEVDAFVEEVKKSVEEKRPVDWN